MLKFIQRYNNQIIYNMKKTVYAIITALFTTVLVTVAT